MMHSRILSCLALSALLLAGALQATEKVPALASRDQATSSLEQVSLKPLVIFSMRGRPDPFMAFTLLTRTAAPELFSINELTMNGVIEMEGRTIAMFSDANSKSYVLRGGQLYGPEGIKVESVQGNVNSRGQVSLQQGGRKVDYVSKRASKRLEPAASR